MSPILTQIVAAERLRDLRVTADQQSKTRGAKSMYLGPEQASNLAAFGLGLLATTFSAVLITGLLA